ncbi:S-adenosyl-L-methionine-dependent methyltransferase [Mycena pura]|uniref:S-adenosyl-L-methionine-dependent methyltransferase n=1 Tax=Mycena pura TaxID=153505 RepID=A0AAD6YBX6_9AGAR|nr:S-adenosyl-L-methionine-dependent methyltransferase [Mycena pura]
MPTRSRRAPPVRPITRLYAPQDVPVTEVEKRDAERARAKANRDICLLKRQHANADPAMANIGDSPTAIELRAAIDAYERKYGKFVADADNAAFRKVIRPRVKELRLLRDVSSYFLKHDDLANVVFLALARAFYEDFGFPYNAGDSDDWDLRRLEKQDRSFRELQRTCKNDVATMRAHAANPVRVVLENPYPHDHPRRLDFDHELRDWANKMRPRESAGPATVNANAFELAIPNPYARDPDRCVEGHLDAVYMGMLLTDMVHDPVLFEKREDRLTGTTGSAALLEFLADECFKSSSQLGDALLDPTGEQNPMTRAFGLTEPMFNWFIRPENRNRITRFALAMHGIAATEPLELIHKGQLTSSAPSYDWSRLPTGSVLVDVGGGLGSTSMEIAKKYPSLRIVNQDLAPTIENAKSHWTLHFPEHVEKKMVELQVHDFFQPQPVQNADIFLLRHVIHDWSDEKSITILKHLRDAAKPTTQLVVIENIVPFACAPSESQDSEFSHIPGAIIHQSPPAPLLSNQGVAIAMMYYYDITIHNLIGGKDRTVGGFAEVFKKAGWDIVHIYRCHGSAEGQCHIVGVPI